MQPFFKILIFYLSDFCNSIISYNALYVVFGIFCFQYPEADNLGLMSQFPVRSHFFFLLDATALRSLL